MNTEVKEEDIKVSEEKDGSAVVEVPESLMPAQEEQDEQKVEATQTEAADDDQDQPDDTDAVRDARRARRKAKKEYIKKTNEEKDRRLVLLARQNQELMERLAAIEKKSHNSDLAQLDKAIEDENARLNYAKAKMREATEASDGQALIRAQELWYDSRDKIEKIKAFKAQAEKQEPTPSVDPVIKELAGEWMEKNDWYDPNGRDRDSLKAKAIDNQLVKEGWDPATPDYWEELTTRLQEELPHRYTQEQDETPRKRGPKSVVTGSEREIGGGASRNTFTLSPEQVRAMKDAGFWDDPKKRAKMIQNYAKHAQQNRS